MFIAIGTLKQIGFVENDEDKKFLVFWMDGTHTRKQNKNLMI